MTSQPEPDLFAGESHLIPVPRPGDAASVPAAVNASPPTVSGNTANVLALIDRGTQNGLAPEALEKLVTLYERVMARDAEAAFNDAKRAFQAECPVIGKNRDVAVDRGPKYRYADLEKIVQTIRPLLERFGFSYDFEQKYAGDIVTVKCYLRHKAGHVQVTEFSGPWATNAGMSAIQKSASATTFCQRYALRMALGLPVGEDDDAPPPRYENPEPDRDAPQPHTRSERSTAVSDLEMKSLYRDWYTLITDKTGKKEDFVFWVRKKLGVGEEFDPTNILHWTRSQYEVCKSAFPPKEDGNGQ